MPKARANGEGSIRQRSDGRYEVKIILGIDFKTGKPKRISKYAATQEEAVKILHEMSFVNDHAPKTFKPVKLGEWLDVCLNVYMKNSLKQSTYLSYESYIRLYFKPSLGDVLLRDLTPRLLQQYYNYLFESGTLASKSISNLNLFLHRALSYAVAEGYITFNPTETVAIPRGEKTQIVILTRDEQFALMNASYAHRYGVFVRLVLFTGLRLGELLGLMWQDVDFAGGLLYVRRTLNRLNKVNRPTNPNEATTEIVIRSPKSENSYRSVPLLPNVQAEMLQWREVQKQDAIMNAGCYYDSGMLVTNPYGGYVEPRTFKDYYDAILKSAGLPHFTFHALRHTFASRALEQGMDAKTLSMILGHSSVSFTLDTYAHVLTDHKIEEMKRMQSVFNQAQFSQMITPLSPNTPPNITLTSNDKDDDDETPLQKAK